jgi:4-amino-4-deoxy-L-arabinose transferase-like glycosyltransferase
LLTLNTAEILIDMKFNVTSFCNLNQDRSIWLFSFILLLSGCYVWPVFDQDEAAYAGFALQMLQSGDWVIPDYYWSDVHRKTPLHFWMIGISYTMFGTNEWALRFPALLSVIGVAWMIWSWIRTDIGKHEARLALLLLTSNILIGVYTRMSVTDGPLLFFQTGAALSLIRYAKKPSIGLALLHAIFLGLGLLQKGPAMLLFSGIVGILFVVAWSPGRNLLKISFLLIQFLAFIPIYYWGQLAWSHDGGEMIRWMIDWYILNRVGGSVFGQTGPPGYHISVIALSFIIILPLFLNTLFNIRKLFSESIYKPYVLWLLAAWIPFEFTASKLPSYALGAYPALAILIAVVATNKKLPFYRFHLTWTLFVPLSFVLILWVLPYVPELRTIELLTYGFFIFIVFVLITMILKIKFDGIKLIALQSIFYLIGMLGFTGIIKENFSLMPKVATDVQKMNPKQVFIEENLKYYPSLPLYLQWKLRKNVTITLAEDISNCLSKIQTQQVLIVSKSTFEGLGNQWNEFNSPEFFSGMNTGRAGIVELVILERK